MTLRLRLNKLEKSTKSKIIAYLGPASQYLSLELA